MGKGVIVHQDLPYDTDNRDGWTTGDPTITVLETTPRYPNFERLNRRTGKMYTLVEVLTMDMRENSYALRVLLITEPRRMTRWNLRLVLAYG